MPGHNVIAVYDTRLRAHEARNALMDSGISEQHIRLSSDGADTASTGGAATQYRGTDADNVGFFDWLFGSDISETDRDRYRSKLDGERTALSVYLPDGKSAEVEEVLERFDPIDVHEDHEAATGAVPHMSDRSTADDQGDQVIPIVREDLDVGKRVEEKRHRIRTYTVERPVEQQINLRDERVVVERRPASGRAVEPGDVGSRSDREYEVIERREVPVVDKQAHVDEEIVVHKEVGERSETVRDTVRETRVDLDGADNGAGDDAARGGRRTKVTPDV